MTAPNHSEQSLVLDEELPADEPADAAPAEPAAPEPAAAASADLLLAAEAILFVAAEPIDYATLARVLEQPEETIPGLVAQLRARFAGRGIRVQELAGKLQLVSAPEATAALERFLGTVQSTRLSAAALEVLAIVAYRQPLTRAQVESIRGVDSSGVIRSLLARDLIHEVGRAETLGRPLLYSTTPQFLHLFGLESLADLPPFELPDPVAGDR
jgi:segregation and condensation protein B